jgi:hypothetical protein
MIEVYPHLWVGDEYDYRENGDQRGWYVVQACKEPFHREALGYTGRAAPKDHPEYLFAYRGTRLILNMVDADDPRYFPDEMIEEALSFLDDLIVNKRGSVLVHCNTGESRAPSLAMLYLATRAPGFPNLLFHAAEKQMKQLYPPYAPHEGIRQYMQQHWERYR